ncbi:putative acetyltransferase [Lachnellula suecica]|uniref:Putative acetyltransferase n=1 Tax=Lachnellula suecica TaxID=602035 RepID=A0A8T9C0B7_9HELO|nr:putative acetyltransferase [Lachnellula suecica]
MSNINDAENESRMLKGELYYAFTPSLIAQRRRCQLASNRFNEARLGDASRRTLLELWREINQDKTPLPPPGASEEEDDLLLRDEEYVEGPVKLDYGYNVRVGKGAFVNSNCTFINTLPITIGARTLIGPNCSFFSGSHPLDPFLRNGINGPEAGAPISIGEDCWFGGNAIVLPGVTIGRGATVGAGSVVTRDVEAFTVVAGNPARVIRRVVPEEKDPVVVRAEAEGKSA